MRRFINPLLLWAACSRQSDLIRQIHFLKVENEVLRSKLNKRITITPRERERLVRYARGVGSAIQELVTIVTAATMMRWLRAPYAPKDKKPQRPGRPRTAAEIEAVVLRIARETGWGYTRILGELKKLGIRAISRSTVVNILKRHGLDPSPERKQATWDEFIKRHAETLWACDFLPRRVMTLKGWRDAYVLVFIHIQSRMAWVSPSTFAPTGAWTGDQTSAFLSSKASEKAPPLVLHDNDSKFAREFFTALEEWNARPVRLQIQAPNLNAYVERFIQSLQQECLDHFAIMGCRHMDYLVKEYLEHYHTERPHQSMANAPLAITRSTDSEQGRIDCRTRLGGVLRHYQQAA